MNLSIPSEKTPLFMKTEFRIQNSGVRILEEAVRFWGFPRSATAVQNSQLITVPLLKQRSLEVFSFDGACK
jgi:hypothetical protein